MTVSDWSTVTTNALSDAWFRIINYLPNLLGAIVILIIGILVSNLFRWIAERVVNAARLQPAFEQLDFAKSLKVAKVNTNLAMIIGEFVRWVILILFLLPAASVLGLPQVSRVLDDIIRYLPNVGSAVLILFLGALFAEFVGNIVRATAAGLSTRTAVSLVMTSRYVIFIFAGLAALNQLGIAPQIINILLTGFVAAIAISLGLAFGLGGQGAASDLIAKIRQDFSKS
jgi:small-conductance mechanosensitive channel